VAAFGHPGTVGADRKSLRTPDTHPPRAYAKWSGREDLNLRPPEPHAGLGGLSIPAAFLNYLIFLNPGC
jgi:hypothetical protein